MIKRIALPVALLFVFALALAACAPQEGDVNPEMSLELVSGSERAPGAYTIVEFLHTPTPEPTIVPPAMPTPLPTSTPLPVRHYLVANGEGVTVSGGVYLWVLDFETPEARENLSCSLFADREAVSMDPPLYEFSEGTMVVLVCDYAPENGWTAYLEFVAPPTASYPQA